MHLCRPPNATVQAGNLRIGGSSDDLTMRTLHQTGRVPPGDAQKGDAGGPGKSSNVSNHAPREKTAIHWLRFRKQLFALMGAWGSLPAVHAGDLRSGDLLLIRKQVHTTVGSL